MQTMTGQQRILAALKREQPDVVPTWDFVDERLMQKILPGCTPIEFAEFLDLDAVYFDDRIHHWNYEVIDEAKGMLHEPFGGTSMRSEYGEWPVTLEPGVTTQEELDAFVVPDPDEIGSFAYLEQLVASCKGKRAIVASIADVTGLVREHLIGDVQMFRAIYRNPDFIQQANELCLEYQLKYMKRCIDIGIDVFWIFTDWAMTSGPMMSPAHLSEFVAPYTKKLVDFAHSYGVPCFKHTDGNIWPFMDILLDTGVDGINPFDPLSGMDLAEGKAKIGDRVCLSGNVDTAELLITGTEEEIRAYVKECIRKAGKGGGYVCMSSNTVHPKVKPEKYVAYVKAVKEFGRYPLEYHIDNLVPVGSGK